MITAGYLKTETVYGTERDLAGLQDAADAAREHDERLELARKLRKAVETLLDDRRGMHWSSLPDETRAVLRADCEALFQRVLGGPPASPYLETLFKISEWDRG